MLHQVTLQPFFMVVAIAFISVLFITNVERDLGVKFAKDLQGYGYGGGGLVLDWPEPSLLFDSELMIVFDSVAFTVSILLLKSTPTS